LTDIASYIDHTLLKADASYADIDRVCQEGIGFGFAAVCLPPSAVSRARAQLPGKRPALATVIGFPFGYSVLAAKLAETEKSRLDGADELDVVINLMALRSGDWSYLEWEMREILKLAKVQGQLIKVIIESGILAEEEILGCCRLYGGLGVDFLKTSTGFAEKGASLDAVRLMRDHLPETVQIKASGGIRRYAFARQLIEAGASRIGCSSGPQLVREEQMG
jgi:deoxyribose-phosphate aldolase